MPRKNQKQSLWRNLLNLSAVLGIFVLITACLCRDDRENNRQSGVITNQSVKSENSESLITEKNNNQKNKKPDNGDFLVEHIPVQNRRYTEVDLQVRQEKLLERAADTLNKNLSLPYDITLRTKDCGDVNAYYDPSDRSITICYELMEHFYKLFKSTGLDDQAAYDKMFDAIRFAFLHELGHAVIDAYKLPVIGNEEDAADRCSSYICLTELGDEGVRAVMAAADAFAIESKIRTPNNRNMAGEHLLQEQRFYNSLCMIYGSNTSKYDFIVTENYLPRERAVRCPSEFDRTVQSWSSLFEPWRKE
jgi:hypothetical protein